MSTLNRDMRRQLTKLSKQEVIDILTDAENEVSSAFLLCAVNVMGKRGWSEEELQQLTLDLVDEYNSKPDYDIYKQQTYERYGITIERDD